MHRGPVHTIRVHSIEDDGEIDYEVVHHETCQYVEMNPPPADSGIPLGGYYNCGVQFVLDGCSIAEIMRDHLERDPALGELRVVCVSTYDDYTHESEAWLEEAPE